MLLNKTIYQLSLFTNGWSGWKQVDVHGRAIWSGGIGQIWSVSMHLCSDLLRMQIKVLCWHWVHTCMSETNIWRTVRVNAHTTPSEILLQANVLRFDFTFCIEYLQSFMYVQYRYLDIDVLWHPWGGAEAPNTPILLMVLCLNDILVNFKHFLFIFYMECCF